MKESCHLQKLLGLKYQYFIKYKISKILKGHLHGLRIIKVQIKGSEDTSSYVSVRCAVIVIGEVLFLVF